MFILKHKWHPEHRKCLFKNKWYPDHRKHLFQSISGIRKIENEYFRNENAIQNIENVDSKAKMPSGT